MATVFDVAAYIIKRHGPLTSLKLQKLVYYSQAWSLVWDELPLFEEEIQAWANGPVVYDLFTEYRGQFLISKQPSIGDSSFLTDSQKETIDIVLETYGDLSARKLSFLTHSEQPWRDARGDLADTERSQNVISPSSMFNYYSTLDSARNAIPVEAIDWAELLDRSTDALEDAGEE